MIGRRSLQRYRPREAGVAVPLERKETESPLAMLRHCVRIRMPCQTSKTVSHVVILASFL